MDESNEGLSLDKKAKRDFRREVLACLFTWLLAPNWLLNDNTTVMTKSRVLSVSSELLPQRPSVDLKKTDAPTTKIIEMNPNVNNVNKVLLWVFF